MKSFVYCLRDLHFLKIFILCCRLCSEQHPFWFGDKNLVMLLELEGPFFLIKDIFIWAACPTLCKYAFRSLRNSLHMSRFFWI